MPSVVVFKTSEKDNWHVVRQGRTGTENTDDKLLFIYDLFAKTDFGSIKIELRKGQ